MGGSLSYKIRSQQALRNKPRVLEQPVLPPRTDGRWEGGGGRGGLQPASRPGCSPPWPGLGGGAAVCVPPRPTQKKYRLPGLAPWS